MLDDVDQIFELTALSQVFGNRDEENIRTPLYTARINGTDYNLCLRDLQKIQTIINSYYENQYGSEGGAIQRVGDLDGGFCGSYRRRQCAHADERRIL